jgi:hypothetical protein
MFFELDETRNLANRGDHRRANSIIHHMNGHIHQNGIMAA